MDHDLPVNFGRFIRIDAQPRMVPCPVVGHIYRKIRPFIQLGWLTPAHQL